MLVIRLAGLRLVLRGVAYLVPDFGTITNLLRASPVSKNRGKAGADF